MSKSFKQKRLLEAREFEIADNGVFVTIRAFFFRNRFKVPFEHVVVEPVEFTIGNPFWLWASGGCATVFALFVFITVTDEQGFRGGLVSLAFLGAAGPFLLLYRLTLQPLLRISSSDRNIDLLPDRPLKSAVEDFVRQVRENANAYVRATYPAHGGSTVDQLERAAALRTAGIISDGEFDELKRELLLQSKTGHGQYL